MTPERKVQCDSLVELLIDQIVAAEEHAAVERVEVVCFGHLFVARIVAALRDLLAALADAERERDAASDWIRNHYCQERITLDEFRRRYPVDREEADHA